MRIFGCLALVWTGCGGNKDSDSPAPDDAPEGPEIVWEVAVQATGHLVTAFDGGVVVPVGTQLQVFAASDGSLTRTLEAGAPVVDGPALGGEPEHVGAAVLGVRHPFDVAAAGEALDVAGDGRRGRGHPVRQLAQKVF